MNAIVVNHFNLIKSNFKNYKEYFFIIPTIIGSVIQIFSLFLVDNNILYFKFFSISQVLIDSLYNLITFSITYIIYILFLLIFGNALIKRRMKKFNLSHNEAVNFYNDTNNNFFNLTLIYSFIAFLFRALMKDIRSEELINQIALITNISLLLLVFIYLNFFAYWVKMRIFIWVLSTTIIIYTMVTVMVMSVKVDNNINFQQAITTIKKEFKSDEVKVIYYNDKFIFFKVLLKNNEKVFVQKLETILE